MEMGTSNLTFSEHQDTIILKDIHGSNIVIFNEINLCYSIPFIAIFSGAVAFLEMLKTFLMVRRMVNNYKQTHTVPPPSNQEQRYVHYLHADIEAMHNSEVSGESGNSMTLQHLRVLSPCFTRVRPKKEITNSRSRPLARSLSVGSVTVSHKKAERCAQRKSSGAHVSFKILQRRFSLPAETVELFLTDKSISEQDPGIKHLTNQSKQMFNKLPFQSLAHVFLVNILKSSTLSVIFAILYLISIALPMKTKLFQKLFIFNAIKRVEAYFFPVFWLIADGKALTFCLKSLSLIK